MREIKFRAWDVGYGLEGWEPRMIYGVEGLYDGSIDHLGECSSFGSLLSDSERFIVMQYTGLKDKNGVEIYEGDVVLFVEDVIVETINGHSRTEPEGNIGSVEFGNGAFWIKSTEEVTAFYSYSEQMFSWDELEVIGNIYENPELLDNK